MYKVSFPHMGKYHIPIQKLMQTLAGDENEVFSAPPMTKRTLELGSKYSPDFVCVPYKYNLGNFIEALEKGANVLIQTGGGCRMGFYGEVQEQTLRDLGYDFEFFMINTTSGNPKDFYNAFKKINPKLTLSKTVAALLLGVRTVYAMDGIEKFVRENIGFEVEEGSLEKLEKMFLAEVKKATSIRQVGSLKKKYLEKLKEVPVNKPEKPIKVGVVGELYVLMEPFSNYFIEKELAKFGIEVKRFLNLSYLMFSLQHLPGKLMKQADGYITYPIGADGTDSVAKTVTLAKEGYDGIIHLKPFGCTPEVNSMPIVQKVSEDYKIPVLFFSFDSQTSETGIKTRIEAFYDMLMMKKQVISNSE